MAAVDAFTGPCASDKVRKLVLMPWKLGGLGFQSAELRADAAWLAPWDSVEHIARGSQSATTQQEREDNTPLLTKTVANATARLRDHGVAMPRGLWLRSGRLSVIGGAAAAGCHRGVDEQ